MSKTIDDIVVIDRHDYDELVAKANKTDAEIEEKANQIYLSKYQVPVLIKFDTYGNAKNFRCPIEFERDGSHWDDLDRLEAEIKLWMDENMQMYGRRMKNQQTAERDCKGLRKQVANLEEYRKKHKIRFTILIWYSIILTINFFLLLTSYVTGLKSLIS